MSARVAHTADRPGTAAGTKTEQKAARYLAEGRLIVQARDGSTVRARCTGSGSADYGLGHNSSSGWYCDCPARKTCAHLIALQLVTTRRTAPGGHG
jgi:uncharacterized Zn finger protein